MAAIVLRSICGMVCVVFLWLYELGILGVFLWYVFWVWSYFCVILFIW